MRLSRSRAWLTRDEIVTGERLLALMEIAIVPRPIKQFHRNLERYAREPIVFDDYSELDEHLLARLSAKRLLFVYTHAFDDFVEFIWPRLSGEGYVLMTHNSDHEVAPSRLSWIEEAGDKLERWFAQNVTVEHPKLVPLPIGIANSMWEHGNLRVLHRAIARQAGRPKSRLVYLHFNTKTHPARPGTWEKLRAAFPGAPNEPPPATGYRSYLAELAAHRFCVCPRGNGIDTHRFWECQYLDVVPIVERSTNTEHWQRCGLPLVMIDDWAEVTSEHLEGEAERLQSSPSAREPLLLSHYAALVRTAMAR
jgi:hypothetical protein